MSWSNTIYLKFADAETFDAAAEAAGLKHVNDDSVFFGSREISLDVIGVLYRDDTPEDQSPVMRQGFHVNARLKDGASLPAAWSGAVIPAPNKPNRNFA